MTSSPSDLTPLPGRDPARPVPPATGVSLHDLTDIARRLRQLTERFDSFFVAQVQRLSDGLQLFSKCRAEADAVHHAAMEIEMQQHAWRQQRDAEIQRLTAASENLSAAWQQLENQQRQQALQAAAAPGATRGGASPPRRLTGGSSPRVTDSHPLPETTLDEITHLKQQIRQHTQRNA